MSCTTLAFYVFMFIVLATIINRMLNGFYTITDIAYVLFVSVSLAEWTTQMVYDYNMDGDTLVDEAVSMVD